MKNRYSKILMIALSIFLLTGCTKNLTDENKKIVRYDASIIKDSVNLMVDYNLDTKKQNNYDVKRKNAGNSIVAKMEKKTNNLTDESIGIHRR